MKSYDLVIHLIEQDSPPEEDERIRAIWKKMPEYNEIVPKEGRNKETYEAVLKIIYEYL